MRPGRTLHGSRSRSHSSGGWNPPYLAHHSNAILQRKSVSESCQVFDLTCLSFGSRRPCVFEHVFRLSMKRRQAASYGVPNAAVVDRVVAVNQDVAEGDDLRVIGNLLE